MAKIKEFCRSLSLRQIVFSLVVILSLVIYALLTWWCNGQIDNLSHQQAAMRWDKDGGAAQVSCFFVRGTQVDDFQIRSFENQLATALSEAAVETDNENARLFVDAYSSQGRITVVSEQSTLEAEAVGIGGDFFIFHPLQLVSGSYFSGDDLMKDSVILDREAAWQLFGSSNIAGMSVTIGGIPHYVAGVVERDKGRLAESAGLKNTVVYVSHETLTSYGESDGISTYEVVAPNPVKHFVYNTVKEKFGIQESDMLVVENSSRYSLEAMIPVVLDFGVRSMQNSAIHFPYWENMARGYEDIRAIVFIFQFLLLLVPGMILLVFLIMKWKGRSWHTKDVILYLVDKKDRALERARMENNKWKHF